MTEPNYPRGKIHPSDEGEIQLAIAVNQNTIILHFGKPIVWFGLGAEDARAIAAKLIELADQIES